MSITNQTENLDNNKIKMSLTKELNRLTNNYINNKFKFSVEYPKKWNVQEEVYLEATAEHNASPDGGLNIFVEGKKD